MAEIFCEVAHSHKTDKWGAWDLFTLNGPSITCRDGKTARLLIPCDLSNLDSALARLPQDHKRLGFRLNLVSLGTQPFLLRPSGSWGEAKVAKKEGKRIGWKPSYFWVTPEGIAAQSLSACSRRSGSDQPPRLIRVATILAEYSTKLNADPTGIRTMRETSGNCMCCGKALTDPLSMSRGIGPDCLMYLEAFLGGGVDLTVEQIEAGLTDG
jgi:hypothetical protein